MNLNRHMSGRDRNSDKTENGGLKLRERIRVYGFREVQVDGFQIYKLRTVILLNLYRSCFSMTVYVFCWSRI